MSSIVAAPVVPVLAQPAQQEPEQRARRAKPIPIQFSPKECRGYKKLRQVMREPITIQALLSLAFVVSNYLGIKISRDYMRRKELVIKWFDEQIDKWEPLIPRLRCEYVLSGTD